MISVIVPTLNRASLLPGLLISLKKQLLPPDKFEVLIIDNGSTDETQALVHSFASILPNVRYFLEAEPGLHAGRHKGMREALGDILVFADDDIEPLPTWLQAIEEVFALTGAALVGGNNLPVFFGSPPAWLSSLWNNQTNGSHYLSALSIQSHPHGQRMFDPYMVWGCNFSIRKEVLLSAGGFHPDGMPQGLIRFRGDGETHVSKYIINNSLKCVYDSRASVYHKVTPERMTLAYFRQRGFNQGVSDSYTYLRNPYVSSPSGYQSLVSARDPVSAFMNKLRFAKRKVLRRILPSSPWTLNPALETFQEGYVEGYAFHQHAYDSDPEVAAWVHKDSYL